jgi:hypothetical protein
VFRGCGQYYRDKKPADTPGIIAACAGIAFALFLGVMRARYLWWPFHPVGLAVAYSFWSHGVWFSWLMAWVVKMLVLKFGGAGTYRKVQYICIGIVVGHVLSLGAWVIITLIQTKASEWGAWLFSLIG